MKDIPNLERDPVREIFQGSGYKGEGLEHATDVIVNNPKAWLAFMMSVRTESGTC